MHDFCLFLAATRGSSATKAEIENVEPDGQEVNETTQRSSSDVAPLPPHPTTGKSPSYIQKRRAKVWSNNKAVTTVGVDGELAEKKEKEMKNEPSHPNMDRRRMTRSKSIVNIMKIHSSTNSIPAAVQGAETIVVIGELFHLYFYRSGAVLFIFLFFHQFIIYFSINPLFSSFAGDLQRSGSDQSLAQNQMVGGEYNGEQPGIF